jgi:hypothetical protein
VAWLQVSQKLEALRCATGEQVIEQFSRHR